MYVTKHRWIQKEILVSKYYISGKNQNVQDLVFYAYQKIQNDLFYIKWCTMYI